MTSSTAPATAIRPRPESADSAVARLRRTFASGRTKPLEWRLGQLAALRALLTENGDALREALHTDLGKSSTEADRYEIGYLIGDIDHTTQHLEQWLAPRPAEVLERFLPASAQVVREPLGVVLVIAPWNYPLQLALAPMVGALAAGNAVLVKPSEMAPATSTVIAHLLPRYLDTQAVAVVEGGVPETTALLEQHFDHIFYTGNGVVGRIVMAAAVQHLTPVTLELGGKSPAVVEPGVDLKITARRIAVGKFLNAGQTCVAPDYVLAIGDTAATLEAELTSAITDLYGDDPATSPEYGRIINDRHFDRLTALVTDGRLVTGGGHDRSNRYLEPTVLADVDPDAPVMQAEIFGPVLPIINVPDLDAAIAFINDRDKPLALYAFTQSETTKQRLIQETSSGGLAFGLPVAHLALPELPFGGVGASGMGRYHGEYSIDTFSHSKGILDKPVS
ncbi:aldehyde dehydrogenase family protein [Streptomyces sp. NPDC002499]